MIEPCKTRCDFYYSDKGAVVFVDGPPHDEPGAAKHDVEISDCLSLDLGLTVLRFRHDNRDKWAQICDDHSYVFGKVRA